MSLFRYACTTKLAGTIPPAFRKGVRRLFQLFLYLSCLTHAISQIVELTAAYTAATHHFYLIYDGRMHRKYTFHADAVGQAANSKGLGNTAMLASDNSAFKHLNSLPVAFFDLYMHPYSIANVQFGHFFELGSGKLLQYVHRSFLLKISGHSCLSCWEESNQRKNRGLSVLMSLIRAYKTG